jgi:hypothetical protein
MNLSEPPESTVNRRKSDLQKLSDPKMNLSELFEGSLVSDPFFGNSISDFHENQPFPEISLPLSKNIRIKPIAVFIRNDFPLVFSVFDVAFRRAIRAFRRRHVCLKQVFLYEEYGLRGKDGL